MLPCATAPPGSSRAFDGRGVNVGRTRGAQRNDAIIVAEGNKTATDILAAGLADDWTARPAATNHIELVEQAFKHGYTIHDLSDAGWTSQA